MIMFSAKSIIKREVFVTEGKIFELFEFAVDCYFVCEQTFKCVIILSLAASHGKKLLNQFRTGIFGKAR